MVSSLTRAGQPHGARGRWSACSRLANRSRRLAARPGAGMLPLESREELQAMASGFEIQARRHWTFQLVLLGSRLMLEGWSEPSAPGEEPLRCSTWLHPLEAPSDVAHGLIAQPRCCL